MKPPRPKATACAAPQTPIRVPSRCFGPALASVIIEPMAATAKAPLATPRAITFATSGQSVPIACVPSPSVSRAAAEAIHPPTVHVRMKPARDLPITVPATAVRIIPTSVPIFCMPASCVELPAS